jgi:DNA (cytosine-5)-methyltransferase 1
MGIVVDNFAGGGGASTGIEAAGLRVDYAINHDPASIEMHAANHPWTEHLCEDVWNVKPGELCGGREVDLAWFSPDCKHHSKAKGGKPVDKKIRGLAWVAVRWAKEARPRVIILENVEEFADWGPLVDGRPDPERRGLTFRRFVGNLRGLGYQVEWRELVAANYGAPTTRKRLFLVARCDGAPIVWPEPTHASPRHLRENNSPLPPRAPWRMAAECIDWDIPCPSIFERDRSLVDSTLRRLALGVKRFVIEAAEPFIVVCNHAGGFRGQGLNEPLRTITAARDATGLVVPYLVGIDNKSSGAGCAWPIDGPARTITLENRHALCAAFLTKFYGTSIGSDMRIPMPVITGGGQHIAEVRAFLVKYYDTGVGQSLREPMHTITTRDRLGLVTVAGVDYQLADLGLRMLTPRELALAQGFPTEYILTGSKSNQVARIGNSVCPPVAEALVRANCLEYAEVAA